jgi:cytochrome c biogenesis protein CcdA
MTPNKGWLIASAGILGLALLAFLALLPRPAEAGPIRDQSDLSAAAHIFFSAGCADCWPYVEDTLLPNLQAQGLAQQSEIHDYTIPMERTRLLEMADGIQLPRSIADSLYAFVPTGQGTLVILGHVPAPLIAETLAVEVLPDRLVLWQPEMHAAATEYRLWAWRGDVQVFSIDTPFAAALDQTLRASGPLPAGLSNLAQLLPAVLVTGLVDSVNPCAFAVILLLIAFLFTLRQSRNRVLKLGLVYVAMIFIVYFAIGLGILQAVRFSDSPHFVARLGAWLLMGLGVLNLIEYFFPNFPIKLHMPACAHERSRQLIGQATLPATMAAGLLVGLCTFPCSGGIYVSIITLLNAKTTLAWGVAYLLIYNLMFVLPLLVILLLVGNKSSARVWAQWERSHAGRIRLWYGLVMVAMGAAMLLWVIPA